MFLQSEIYIFYAFYCLWPHAIKCVCIDVGTSIKMTYTAKTLTSHSFFLPIGLSFCCLRCRHSSSRMPAEHFQVIHETSETRSSDRMITERSQPTFIPEGKQNIYGSLFLVIGPGRPHSVLWQVTGWIIRVLKSGKGYTPSQLPISWVPTSLPEVQQPRREADCLSPSRAEVTKGLSSTCTPISLQDVDRDSFTCTGCF
jgi:hypothetical protein